MQAIVGENRFVVENNRNVGAGGRHKVVIPILENGVHAYLIQVGIVHVDILLKRLRDALQGKLRVVVGAVVDNIDRIAALRGSKHLGFPVFPAAHDKLDRDFGILRFVLLDNLIRVVALLLGIMPRQHNGELFAALRREARLGVFSAIGCVRASTAAATASQRSSQHRHNRHAQQGVSPLLHSIHPFFLVNRQYRFFQYLL